MIQRSVVVRVPPESAFRTWTERIGLWWPPGHRLSGDKSAHLKMEPRVGGRFFERCTDGREFDYGTILEWSPPERLRFAFFLGSGAEFPTHVEVQFSPIDGGTEVNVHQGLGELSRERFETIATRFSHSWTLTTRAFADYVNTFQPQHTRT